MTAPRLASGNLYPAIEGVDVGLPIGWVVGVGASRGRRATGAVAMPPGAERWPKPTA